jgi:hypothetical protein
MEITPWSCLQRCSTHFAVAQFFEDEVSHAFKIWRKSTCTVVRHPFQRLVHNLWQHSIRRVCPRNIMFRLPYILATLHEGSWMTVGRFMYIEYTRLPVVLTPRWRDSEDLPSRRVYSRCIQQIEHDCYYFRTPLLIGVVMVSQQIFFCSPGQPRPPMGRNIHGMDLKNTLVRYKLVDFDWLGRTSKTVPIPMAVYGSKDLEVRMIYDIWRVTTNHNVQLLDCMQWSEIWMFDTSMSRQRDVSGKTRMSKRTRAETLQCDAGDKWVSDGQRLRIHEPASHMPQAPQARWSVLCDIAQQ